MYQARVVAALVVLGLGIIVILLSGQLPYGSEFGPGPGFLPTWIGWVLAVSGAGLTVQELRAPRTAESVFQPRTVVALKVVGAIVAAFLLVPVLGFSITFGVFMIAGMRIMGSHRWWSCASAAVATTVCVHQVFASWLDIPLPTGLIGF